MEDDRQQLVRKPHQKMMREWKEETKGVTGGLLSHWPWNARAKDGWNNTMTMLLQRLVGADNVLVP